MKSSLWMFFGSMLLCGSVWICHSVRAANHTDLEDAEIDRFVNRVVEAIQSMDRQEMLSLLHPELSACDEFERGCEIVCGIYARSYHSGNPPHMDSQQGSRNKRVIAYQSLCCEPDHGHRCELGGAGGARLGAGAIAEHYGGPARG